MTFCIGAAAQNTAHESELSATNSSTAAASSVYSEQLRRTADSANAQGSNPSSQAKPNVCDSEGVAYRERLRRLANGEDVRNSASASARTEEGCQASVAKPHAEAEATHPDTQTPGTATQTPSAVVAGTWPEKKVSEHSAIAAGARERIPETNAAEADQRKASEDKGSDAAYADSLRRISTGQAPPPEFSTNLTASRDTTTERNFVKNLAFDQLHIWASPFKMRDTDATWAVPFGIATGALIATDHDTSKQLAKPSRLNISKQISDAGLYATIGAGAGFYGLGLVTHDEHKRETGLLAGEAFVNAALVAEALKYAVGRQRPFEADHFGHIGKGGSSFPSGHAIETWAGAAVIAHEYPNPLVQIGAYGVAATVAATRVTAGQHFPSDVLVGSTFGYLIGRKIYNDHHNPDLGGAEYGTFVREHKSDAEHSGSAYVPLDSWVYPVIDRLAALGFVNSNFDSERPFTRLECARIAQEASDRALDSDPSRDILGMIHSLQEEFAREFQIRSGDSTNRSIELESVYSRGTEISGPPLRDGYHFGQTLYNDFGRPYARGFNAVTGISARAASGPLLFYFRGEYQHAPANPIYTTQQKVILSGPFVDNGTPQFDYFGAADRFQVLDAYVGVNFAGNQLSLGPQSLWWGPGSAGPFLLTDNAEPLNMVRISRVSPLEIPGLSRFLGPVRYEAFLGQTDGQHFILKDGILLGPHLTTQPFLEGQRFSFKPTPNFQFGFSRTGMFGGNFPLTAHRFFFSTFSFSNGPAGTTGDAGDRRTGVDLTYRIPYLRDRLTFFLDEFSEDEVSPLFFPRRSAMHSGIYLAKLPKLTKLDLRVEGIYTDIPSFGDRGTFYFNQTFRNGYTKNGDVLGSWIGREGRGVYATSTAWLSARSSVEFRYREATADHEFALGGRYQDESITLNLGMRSGLDFRTLFQYEHWRFPVLAQGPQTNFVSSVGVSWSPSWRLLPKQTSATKSSSVAEPYE